MDHTNCLTMIKALSNETRLNILLWLKQPGDYFGGQSIPAGEAFEGGVCVGSIQAKAGLTQSVISGYLASMQKAGLLESRRIGQWTYYRRDEQRIEAFVRHLQTNL